MNLHIHDVVCASYLEIGFVGLGWVLSLIAVYLWMRSRDDE